MVSPEVSTNIPEALVPSCVLKCTVTVSPLAKEVKAEAKAAVGAKVFTFPAALNCWVALVTREVNAEAMLAVSAMVFTSPAALNSGWHWLREK